MFRSYLVIWKTTFPFRNDPLMAIPDFSRNMKKKAEKSLQIISSGKIPAALVGNPKILKNLDFEQDLVRPLHDVLDHSDTVKAKSLVDQFIEFNKQLTGLGIIDKSFNITKNFGLNGKDNMVLLDIGEIIDDPKLIEAQIAARPWSKNYVVDHIKDHEARQYFIEQMDKNFL